MSCDVLSRLSTTGNFMLQMSPLQRTSFSFNDVNSFNSFLDPCGDFSTKFEEYCYHVSGKKMTEEETQQYCDKEMDVNLAKINSQEENNFGLALVNKNAPSAVGVWIGHKWKNSPKDFYPSQPSRIGLLMNQLEMLTLTNALRCLSAEMRTYPVWRLVIGMMCTVTCNLMQFARGCSSELSSRLDQKNAEK